MLRKLTVPAAVAALVVAPASVEARIISEAETLAGIKAPVEVRMNQVYVGGAKVVSADVMASNDVIHVIDP